MDSYYLNYVRCVRSTIRDKLLIDTPIFVLSNLFYLGAPMVKLSGGRRSFLLLLISIYSFYKNIAYVHLIKILTK